MNRDFHFCSRLPLSIPLIASGQSFPLRRIRRRSRRSKLASARDRLHNMPAALELSKSRDVEYAVGLALALSEGLHCEIRLNVRRRPLWLFDRFRVTRRYQTARNESGLRDCILFRHPSHSGLPNHVHCFDSFAKYAKRLRMSRTLSPARSASSLSRCMRLR